MKLRLAIANNIISNVEVYDFTREDFIIKFGDDDSDLVAIIFRAKPEYSFTIYEAHTSIVSLGADKKVKTQESPGKYKNIQIHTHESIESCYSSISHWVGRIKEELRAIKYSAISDVEDILDEICANVDSSVEDKDSYFSSAEIETINQKLRVLQGRVKDLEEKHEFSEETSSNIQRAIELSKKDLPNYPKGVWYKISITRIVKALKSCLGIQEVRAFFLDAAKKLFLE